MKELEPFETLIVGDMGQGKSSFLQSLTGLKDDVIPAREGRDCTEVTKTILMQKKKFFTQKLNALARANFLTVVVKA